MALNIYLATTVFSIYSIITFMYVGAKRIKKEGYKIKKVNENLSLTQKMLIFFKALVIAVPLLVPIINLGIALVSLFKFDEVYEEIKTNLLEQGDIYKVDNQQQIKKLNLQKQNKKSYLEMTKEEKIAYLESEKAKLLEEANNQNTNPVTLKKKL